MQMDTFSLIPSIITFGLLALVVFAVVLLVRRRGERDARARSALLKGFAVGFGIGILTGGLQEPLDRLFPAPGSINFGLLIDLLAQGFILGVLIGGISAIVSLRRSRQEQRASSTLEPGKR